jgi:hypothetical protein
MSDPEIEGLCQQMQLKGGAHAHTSGKACFYLRALDGKPNAKFSNCSRADFIEAVRGAAYRGEWGKLKDLMGRWW